MKKWEYIKCCVPDLSTLNYLGEEGWELINTSVIDKMEVHIFKREK